MAVDAASILDRAVDWHLRQADMGEAEWHAFVAWLEASPAHARAFDAVALDMATLPDRPELFRADTPARARQPVTPAPGRRVWRWAGAGLALAVAAGLAVVIAPSLADRAAPYAIATRPGERRNIALADGTRIDLNGASRLVLDRTNARVATLKAGEATFHVRHDPRDPFTVHSGGLTVQDAGTVFNVERDGPRLDVQVAKGSVVFQPRRDPLMLRAGAAISVREDRGSVALGRVDVARVGGWRSRGVAFAGEPFGRVAAALLRLDGAALSIDPALSKRPFTGMIRLSGTAERDVPHLAALVGARWRRDGERWVLSPR